MRYTKYSPRSLEEQDAYMWDAAEFDLLLNNLRLSESPFASIINDNMILNINAKISLCFVIMR